MKFQEIKIRETIEGPTFQISLEETYACASQITKTDFFFFLGGGGKGVFYMGSNIRSCKEGRWKDYGRIFTGMKDL